MRPYLGDGRVLKRSQLKSTKAAGHKITTGRHPETAARDGRLIKRPERPKATRRRERRPMSDDALDDIWPAR